jgi:phosphatidylserine decarboxylase
MNKFFSHKELLGRWQTYSLKAFNGGEYAVFRLTPDKYHYNHMPVSGNVLDFYVIDGQCHSCNPAAVVAEVTPFSKNKRVVTIIDTDVTGGTHVGLVAMVEVVALMIGDIVQAYSHHYYNNPQPMRLGMYVKKGQPKSLFRPGSSVVILFFQKSGGYWDPYFS